MIEKFAKPMLGALIWIFSLILTGVLIEAFSEITIRVISINLSIGIALVGLTLGLVLAVTVPDILSRKQEVKASDSQ